MWYDSGGSMSAKWTATLPISGLQSVHTAISAGMVQESIRHQNTSSDVHTGLDSDRALVMTADSTGLMVGSSDSGLSDTTDSSSRLPSTGHQTSMIAEGAGRVNEKWGSFKAALSRCPSSQAP